MFIEAFMQRALLAALLLGPFCALLGVFVTARRMAFFSDTIAHGGLTGVARNQARNARSKDSSSSRRATRVTRSVQ